ncbi:MAG: radical SAM protein, partial [Deltaproteobacteria bacterium]|nr:radical SAM protein [Deltaproteobacteria bacterium]
MTLGNALRAAARVRPHFFNSFYRRVRVFREAPRAMGAAATVDLTHACSLHCPFCIAAGVRDRAAMPLGTFRRVARALSGVERLTLLGGEPFLHPQIAAVSGLAFRAAREVEIFTNGLALGTEPTAAGARINERLGDSGSDRLTVVLSVDPEHAGQMKPGRLARAVECLLEAERQHVCRARFSITHPALPTGRYIDAATVRDAIAEVSPALGDLFVERLVTGEAQDAFYFNPVVCSRPGEGGGAAPAAELLRLEDLVFSPEIAVTFGPRAGAPMFSALASVWSTDPPGATRLGDALDPGAAR